MSAELAEIHYAVDGLTSGQFNEPQWSGPGANLNPEVQAVPATHSNTATHRVTNDEGTEMSYKQRQREKRKALRETPLTDAQRRLLRRGPPRLDVPASLWSDEDEANARAYFKMSWERYKALPLEEKRARYDREWPL